MSTVYLLIDIVELTLCLIFIGSIIWLLCMKTD